MTTKTRSILLAAVLATPLAFFAAPADAQNRIETGASNDANNRIGSGGSNGGPRDLGINSGDFIINGTVTGGREFRGRTAIGDPRAFRGPTAGGTSDRFIRESSSAYNNNAQQVKPFYGPSLGAPPPAGFMQQAPGQTTYTPAPPPERMDSDLRMGAIYNTDRTKFVNPMAGELMMPGPIDNSNTQSLLRASPLYGVVEDNGSQLSDPTRPGTSNFRRRNTIQDMDEKEIQAARDELSGDNAGGASSDLTPKANDQDLGSKTLIGKPKDGLNSPHLPGGTLDSTIKNQSLNGQIRAEGSQRNELVPPMEQMTQYAELHNRYAKTKATGPMTDQQATNEYNKQFQDRQRVLNEEKNKQRGGMPGSGSIINRPSGGGRLTIPGGGIPSGGGATSTTPPAVKSTDPANTDTTPAIEPKGTETKAPPVEPAKEPTPAPAKSNNDEAPALNTRPGEMLNVTSLTDGMKPGRVKDMLTSAEDLMRQGKYTGAIDQYDYAERIVPNNPLITLGRANAELGASYYARAEGNIRKALEADNALLVAKFDLVKFLGKDRVAFLEKDLKDVVTTEPKQARAPFLLAYLKFHTGDKKMAANYLALSEQRLGKEDPLYKQMRLTWDLPKADPLPESK